MWPTDDLSQKCLVFGALQLPGRAGAGARAAVVAEFVTHLVAEGLEVFHDVRMLGFDVGGFADVLFHVEQRQPNLGLAVAGGNAVRAAGPSGHGAVAVREVQPGNIWFSTSAIPDRIGPELAALARESGVKSVAIIANVLPFAQENLQFLVPALKAEGIEIALNESYPPDISDMTGLLSQIKAAGVDGVIALSYPADSFLYMGQAREVGIDAPFEFLLVGPTISAFSQAFGDFADGVVTIGHWSPHQSQWSRAKPFFDAYVDAYGMNPDYLDTALAYMSCEILEQAVASAGLDRDKLRTAIASSTFDTINGEVSFEGVENAVTPTAFLQLQGGDMHLIWPKSIATADFIPR